MERVRRQAMLSWLALGLLAILFCVLALLQYRWIGEISLAERARLRDSLQTGLNRVSRDFNAELSRAIASLQPSPEEVASLGPEPAYAQRLARWKSSAKFPDLFRTVAVAVPSAAGLTFRVFGPQQGSFSETAWPEEIRSWQETFRARLDGGHGLGSGPGGPGGPGGGGPGGGFGRNATSFIDIPRFGESEDGGRREQDWLILEVNADAASKQIIPELVALHLGTASATEYDIELSSRFSGALRAAITGTPSRADSQEPREPDATVAIFESRIEGGGPRRAFRGDLRLGGDPPPPPGPPDAARGRWLLSAWHHAGTLDTVVRRARWRNLGVAFGILLLMIGTVVALLRFSKQAQKLADMQMQFVAGVSHELRTPLTVIRTAAYNLRGRMAGNPAQVELYGKLIQDESERLSAIVDQVMLFAGAKAGQVIRERKPFAVETTIDESLRSSRSALESSACTVDKQVESNLPLLLGDSVALRHAVQNLIQNAIKYGLETEKWIGVRAAKKADGKGDRVEISVEDHGPGIQPSEAQHIFDPFFRGERAVRDQVHGTGLGLNLVKQIVEAHGGTVTVESEPGRGTRFVLSIPAAPEQYQDEFANSVS